MAADLETTAVVENKTASSSNLQSDDKHYVYKNDPLQFKNYVYREVIVTSVDGAQNRGWVHTIDPVSGSIVLVEFEDRIPNKIHIVIGHAIKDIKILTETQEDFTNELNELGRVNMKSMTSEQLQKQKCKVKSWLLKHRIPLEESGPNNENLSVMDVLVLSPPYGPEDCNSANEIILGKIQGLIKAMPDDVEEW